MCCIRHSAERRGRARASYRCDLVPRPALSSLLIPPRLGTGTDPVASLPAAARGRRRWRGAKVCFDMLAPPAPREGWGGSGAAGPPRQSPSGPSWGPQATAPVPRLSLHRWLHPCQRCGAQCPRAQAAARGSWCHPWDVGRARGPVPPQQGPAVPSVPSRRWQHGAPRRWARPRPWRCLPPPPVQASVPEHGAAPGMEGGRRGGQGTAAAAGAACLHAWGSLPVSLRCLESRRRRGSKY